MTKSIPNKGIVSTQAQVEINCELSEAFDYISSCNELKNWLKKYGPIPSVEKVELLSSSYDSVGDKRKVIFESGDSVVEELLSTDSPANYSYQISDFSNFIGKLSSIAYGQLWFDNEDGKTRITWNYSFKYKNIFAKIFLHLFLKMTYRKFMLQGLINVKNNLEKNKPV